MPEIEIPSNFTTARLVLSSLTPSEDKFIFELVNTPGWLRFIGDRNIRTTGDACGYINKINQNDSIKYWLVSLREEQIPIGIITFIKREYLEFPDVGFAFLPAYKKCGYAFEATSVVLNYLLICRLPKELFAITDPENIDSIRLLEKLGFKFRKAIEIGKQNSLVYELQ